MKHFIAAVALAFLGEPAIMQMLDQDSRAAVTEKKFKMVESPFYVKSNITAKGGEIELITTSLSETHGVVNIDKARLPELENLILEGLTVGHYYGTDAAGAAKYSTVADSNLQGALANASIIIKQDNVELVNLPVALFLQSAASDRARVQEGWNFDNYRLIKANRVFNINLKFPEGVSMPAAGVGGEQYLIAIWLKGQVTKLK